MTPRQRVLAALDHQEPDRVPIDFGGHRSSGIAAMAYAKLRKALGLAERPVRVYDERLTFWGGGCDTHQVLSRSTPENVIAMLEAAREFGGNQGAADR